MIPVLDIADKALAAYDATMTFATAALPPTENRIANFKLLYPKRYARVKRKILNQAYHWYKHHTGGDIEAYCGLIATDEEDKRDLINLLRSLEKK